MSDAPETLTQALIANDERIVATVWREVAEDDLGIERITGEQFSEWLEANLDRVLKSAIHKLKHVLNHELVSGSVHIKAGELVG